MRQVVIENPILNSPFKEPTRHFRFDDEGITNDIVEGRRTSSYFVPIARPKKRGGAKQESLFDAGRTKDRIEENKLVNRILERVGYRAPAPREFWITSGAPSASSPMSGTGNAEVRRQ